MGLFGGLLEKKNCAICGKELGVFGKTKIAEGHLCKDCAGKLSPYFSGYGKATVEDIRGQLSYREENERKVESFNVTTTIDGGGRKVYLDEDAHVLILSGASNWRGGNPDVIAFEQVTGCDVNVRETKTEVKHKDAEGKEVSYEPKRYDIDYDVHVKVFFNHPYFTETSWRVNSSRIERKPSPQFDEAMRRAEEVRGALVALHEGARAAAAPRQAVRCPACGATTMPDTSMSCEYCGSSLA